MAWVEGTEEQRFTVKAALEDAVAYFGSPARFCEAFTQLDAKEQLSDDTWRWTLVEKAEKGITYQASYVVRYATTGNTVTWETLEGNMKSTGVVVCAPSGSGTAVHYKETLACDLPIPRLAAKIFQPIVAREIRSGVGEFLDLSRAILDRKS
ncbi:MAG: hypothetical protein R3E66_23200 [bacterium]